MRSYLRFKVGPFVVVQPVRPTGKPASRASSLAALTVLGLIALALAACLVLGLLIP